TLYHFAGPIQQSAESRRDNRPRSAPLVIGILASPIQANILSPHYLPTALAPHTRLQSEKPTGDHRENAVGNNCAATGMAFGSDPLPRRHPGQDAVIAKDDAVPPTGPTE